MKLHRRGFNSLACLLAYTDASPAAPDKRKYAIDGSLSREVLENYLSRSITMTELY